MTEMKNLVRDAKSGDHFVFHCGFPNGWSTDVLLIWSACDIFWWRTVSGHGAQIPNEDRTELDGMDEGVYNECEVAHTDTAPMLMVVSHLARRHLL